MKSVLFLSFALTVTRVLTEEDVKTYKLELVQALIRHGDRIPDEHEVYKTDPYNPEYYVPTGYGQLTNVGMQREYQVGQLLRKRYANFIGEYRSNKVYAYSTDFDRTKMSLQLVLAGLFPPSPENAWNKELLWSPIPTHYQPFNSDFLVSSLLGSCGKYSLKNLQQEMKDDPKIERYMADHKDFLNYVVNKTEIRDAHIYTVASITENLLTIRSMNLALPSWCSEQDFNQLYDVLALTLESLTINYEIRKQTAGPIVKQFLDNMKGHKQEDDLKIYVYCGHDINIASYTGAHNFTGIPGVPEFGSTLIIEKLRGSDNEAYVRMYLWTGVTEKLIKLKLENCDYECPLSTYEEIVKPILPDPELVKCIEHSLHCNEGSPDNAVELDSKNFMQLILLLPLKNIIRTITS